MSIALNVAESMYSRGNNRGLRYHSALGSPRETLACLEVVEAYGYVAAAVQALIEQLKRVVGTLMELVSA